MTDTCRFLCNDLTDCALIIFSDVALSELQKNYVETEAAITIIKQYELQSDFLEKILRKEAAYNKVKVTTRLNGETVKIFVNIPYNDIMEAMDVISLDVKLMLAQSSGVYSLGAMHHVVEVAQ